MLIDSWFPLRFEILPGVFAGKVLHSGSEYEIREVHGAARRALVVRPQSLDLWINAGWSVPAILSEFKTLPSHFMF